MQYPPIISIPNNPSLHGMAGVIPDVVYSTARGMDLKLSLILPWHEEETPPAKRPLIVFVQGSGWTSPDISYQLPQLGRYAQFGHAVATVTHRSSKEGHPFPAYLQDVKTAIRFLRAHADEYGLDTERICIFGTSSGGNTALLVGLTPNDPRYETEEYADQSSAVKTVISCFGPTDLQALVGNNVNTFLYNPDFSGLLPAGWEPEKLLTAMSPIAEIIPGCDYPPILLAQGDADELVPFSQSESMYHALLDAGCSARLIRVLGAPHEGSFWSNRLFGLIADFLRETL